MDELLRDFLTETGEDHFLREALSELSAGGGPPVVSPPSPTSPDLHGADREQVAVIEKARTAEPQHHFRVPDQGCCAHGRSPGNAKNNRSQ